jgi:hypothetical protein
MKGTQAEIERLKGVMRLDAKGHFLSPIDKLYLMKRLSDLGDPPAVKVFAREVAKLRKLASENNNVALAYLRSMGL